jgi:hypothetical protein
MSRLIDILTMGDSVKAWSDMQDEERLEAIENSDARKYLWVLDFELGRVFMYNIRRADLQHEDYEDLMTLKGHSPSNCEWMVCKSDKIYN